MRRRFSRTRLLDYQLWDDDVPWLVRGAGVCVGSWWRRRFNVDRDCNCGGSHLEFIPPLLWTVVCGRRINGDVLNLRVRSDGMVLLLLLVVMVALEVGVENGILKSQETRKLMN